MKKLNIFGLFLLMTAFLTGCKEESIVLTSELPQFETREGLMLLEVIVPYGTGINDQIYIYGDFNGGEDAIGNPQWLLQRGNPQTGVPAKFGIYVNPDNFVNGKTLADGYSFYNIQNGPEVDREGTPVYHYDYPKVGDRLNVFVDYWEGSLQEPEDPDDVEHDGYAIYILNNAGWTDLYMWAWEEGSGGEDFLGTGWPGVPATGNLEINGTRYTYFDTGANHEGLTINVIISDNGSPQSETYSGVTLNKDYYFELTSDGTLVEIDPNASIEHDGYVVYAYNNTGWEEVALYMWGDVNDLGGGWPGALPTGTIVINGVGYLYWDLGEANTGLNENLIFNNNAPDDSTKQQLSDYNFTIDKDLYVELTLSGVTVINPDEFKPGGDTPEEPSKPEPTPTSERYVYVVNETGWSPLYVYSWNDAGTELCGKWPGISSTETTEINGVTYTVFLIQSDNAENNLIFNDGVGGEGGQLADYNVVLDQNYYLKATSSGVSELETPMINIYANNQTTWDEIALYAWGDGPELFGGWPGLVSTTTKNVNGVEYLVYPAPANGMTYNLIFNNNNHELQLSDFPVTLNKDLYLMVTDSEVKFAQ